MSSAALEPFAELQPAVAIVAERHFGAAHVEVGVGLRVELVDVVGVVRARADLECGAEGGLAERCVGVEAEAGTGRVVVDDENVGRDPVVDDVEGRIDLRGEGERPAAPVDPREALGDHLGLRAIILVRRWRGGSGHDRHRGGRRARRRGGGVLGLERVQLGTHGVDLLLLGLDHHHHPVDVGGACLLGGGRGGRGEGDERGGGGAPRSCRKHDEAPSFQGWSALGPVESGVGGVAVRSMRRPRKAKAIETRGLTRVKKAKGT